MPKPIIETKKESEAGFKGSNVFLNIPAQVAHDTDLRPMSRLLFGEINSMMNVTHEFYMSNATIEKRLGMTDPTLRNCFHELENKGYIQRTLVKDENGRTMYRAITTNMSVSFDPPKKSLGGTPKSLGEVPQKTLGGSPKEFKGGTPKNLGVNRADNRAGNRAGKDILLLKPDAPSEPPKKKKNEITPETREASKKIIAYLNQKTGASYKPSSSVALQKIQARLNDGYKVSDFFQVISAKYEEWSKEPRMLKYMRPSTLFNTKFDEYLNQAKVSSGGDDYPTFEEMAKETEKRMAKYAADDLPF